ncbi:MAG TPA: FtsH protease activity modulator HflK [Candidatus Atribacteria bacterium]|nr:FtsH protease activity modulator HflK [Candidatus Atribacteria bacterium]HPT78216.1 FtsH protease activity modulator HflK [Candidatus Atribacteria bacterium]
MNTISMNRIRFEKNLKKWLPVIIIALIAVILASSSLFIVDTGHAVIITRFGRVDRVVQDAGINFKLPLIEKAVSVSLEKRHQIEYGYRTKNINTTGTSPEYYEVAEEQTVIVEAEGDNSSLVLTELIVEYQVSDPLNYLYKVDNLESTIRLVLEDTLRNTLQSVTLNQALTDKQTIDNEIKPELQRVLNSYEAGIRIIEVKTQNTSLLPSVDEAYREIEKANQYRMARIEEAQKYENTVIPQAEAEAAQLIEEAKGYKAARVAEARAEVSEFLALYEEYRKNPSVIREKIYTEAMQAFLRNNNVVIDTTSGNDIFKFYNMGDDSARVQQQLQAITGGKGGSGND